MSELKILQHMSKYLIINISKGIRLLGSFQSSEPQNLNFTSDLLISLFPSTKLTHLHETLSRKKHEDNFTLFNFLSS